MIISKHMRKYTRKHTRKHRIKSLFKRILNSASKKLILSGLAMSLMLFIFFPVNVFADGVADYYMPIIANYIRGEMMSKLQQYAQDSANQITNKAEDIFKEKTDWEKWPASLKEFFVEQSVKLEDQSDKLSYTNVQDYLNYTQGTASGVDASKQPAQAVAKFNQKYSEVQKMNPSCQLDVPQVIGDSSNQCTPAQTQFTNYLVTGVHPIPTFPKDATQTAAGQQYETEQKVYNTRSALAQLALNQATNDKENQFIQYMQKNLQNPSIDQINTESSSAIARDALILDQAKAIIALKQYEATLMNERLLATIVSQNEELHLKQIRALAQNLH